VKPRSAAVVVLAAALAWFATRKASTGGQTPPPDLAAGPSAMDRTTGWAGQILGWIPTSVAWTLAHLWLMGALALIAALLLLVHAVRAHRSVLRDPQRMYTPEQRRESFALAGGQCEYTGALLTRCRRPAEHADHLVPWSRGGATSLANCAAACAPCNLSKGAKVLPAWRVRMLVRRRKRYYPADVDRTCGERYAERINA
jgi:heme exporter protein D